MNKCRNSSSACSWTSVSATWAKRTTVSGSTPTTRKPNACPSSSECPSPRARSPSSTRLVGKIDRKTYFLSCTLDSRGCSLWKILVHPPKNQKNLKKFPKNPRIFFWGFKILTPYLGVNSPSISVFKSFFIHKILVHQKNPKNLKKSEKSIKIQGFLWGFKIRTPYLEVNNPSLSILYFGLFFKKMFPFRSNGCKSTCTDPERCTFSQRTGLDGHPRTRVPGFGFAASWTQDVPRDQIGQ